ncbi:MAG: YdiU family protein [Betaproteobacteria bacterium]|nr:YdiU family protein [Betaproteobacteria bacterium]
MALEPVALPDAPLDIPPDIPPDTRTGAAPAACAPPLRLRQAYAELGPEFHSTRPPQGLPQPRLRLVSADAARLLGLRDPGEDPAQREAWARMFSGNQAAAEGGAISTVYAGHQFGNWAGQLGDGRAHLLGETAAHDAAQSLGHPWWEVQIKGAGLTPYSRRGDGRAVLRSSIREFLCSEAMWHLGVPTTRALCLVDSELAVRRETLETAAVVTRLSPSFVRFGHFEHFSYSGRHEALRKLVDYTVARLYPHLAGDANPALALLREVVRGTASLIARWQCVGFVHGVMNTDNMSMLGWTIDYGPFGFMDSFDPAYTPNTTDVHGRYAWARQPAVARWNLLALAQALLPLIGDEQAARDAVEQFADEFMLAMRDGMQAKLGLGEARDDDPDLVQDWLDLLADCRADWTVSHRLLAQVVAHPDQQAPAGLRAQFDTRPQRLHDWLARLRQRLHGLDEARRAQRAEAMLRANPCYVLRHHLAQAAIAQAREGDFGAVWRLHEVLRDPWREQPGCEDLAAPPPADAPPPVLSCSS